MVNNTSIEHFYSHISVIRGLTCDRLLYLHKNNPELKGKTQKLNNLIGRRNGFVKELAVSYLSKNLDYFKVNEPDTSRAASQTTELLNEDNIFIQKPLFLYDHIYSSLDFIVKKDDKIFVYSIQARTSGKRNRVTSLGYQIAVAKLAGLKYDDVFLVTLNPDYNRGSSLSKESLFNIESVKEALEDEMTYYTKGVKYIHTNFPKSEEPSAKLDRKCFKGGVCVFFEHCFPEVNSSKIMEIGGMHLDDKLELISEGKTSLDDLPEDFELNDFSKIQLSTNSGKQTIIDYTGLRNFFDKFSYPLYYTDFEAIQPAIPIYEDTSSYRQIPFQFYLIRNEANGEVSEYSFLPEGTEDPREAFLNSFLKETEGAGSIIVFDKTSEIKMLRELLKVFPEKEKEVNSRIERIIDLKDPFDQIMFYHYEMKGSKTLKSIISVVKKEEFYKNLEIANGGSASFIFELYLYGIIDKSHEELKEDLLEYCKTDVVSMVEIVKFLKRIINYAG